MTGIDATDKGATNKSATEGGATKIGVSTRFNERTGCAKGEEQNGAPAGIRTPDQEIKSLLLYQLSY